MLTPAIWFPTVKTNSGTDSFTERLVEGLNNHNIRAEIARLQNYIIHLSSQISGHMHGTLLI